MLDRLFKIEKQNMKYQVRKTKHLSGTFFYVYQKNFWGNYVLVADERNNGYMATLAQAETMIWDLRTKAKPFKPETLETFYYGS